MFSVCHSIDNIGDVWDFRVGMEIIEVTHGIGRDVTNRKVTCITFFSSTLKLICANMLITYGINYECQLLWLFDILSTMRSEFLDKMSGLPKTLKYVRHVTFSSAPTFPMTLNMRLIQIHNWIQIEAKVTILIIFGSHINILFFIIVKILFRIGSS